MDGVVEGLAESGCWHGRWRQPVPDCLGGWVGSPSGDRAGGVGHEGLSHKRSRVYVFVESREGVIEGEELDLNPTP